MTFVERGMHGMALPLAYATFALANIGVYTIAIGTVWLVIRGRILPAPLSSIASLALIYIAVPPKRLITIDSRFDRSNYIARLRVPAGINGMTPLTGGATSASRG